MGVKTWSRQTMWQTKCLRHSYLQSVKPLSITNSSTSIVILACSDLRLQTMKVLTATSSVVKLPLYSCLLHFLSQTLQKTDLHCPVTAHIATETILYFNSNNLEYFYTHMFCVHFTLYMCTGFCPVDQLLAEHIISWLLLFINYLCHISKTLSKSVFNISCWKHRISNSMDKSHKVWEKLHDWAGWFLIRDLWRLFHSNANSRLKVAMNWV
jgi:hypothetical protein